ncbi:hypothetical protein SAMN02745150_00933 [Brevinema andersonii]|uniref:Uncharacterized protein n=1 Tax=Brevinema andersonii TaxID=34097 RepID=A0A1I1EAG6_BREAD|nr:hypothetical protein [Brevinema andersonii]SFB81953.1 hypothetical protein SAMN02745150_00933 [Brevinema andersonii]
MRKKLLLVVVFLILVLLGVQFITQSYIVSWERQFHFSRKALKKANIIAQNIKTSTSDIYQFTNAAYLGEIFANQRIIVPDIISNKIQRIRLTDSSGKIILSTDGISDAGNIMTPHILELARSIKTNFIFFLPNRDVLVALGFYENPYTLNSVDKGYIMFEFPATIMFHGLDISRYFVKRKKMDSWLIITDNSRVSYEQVMAVDPNNSTGPVTGFKLNMPFLGSIVYFVGNDFYIPPVLSTLFIFLLVFLLWKLFYEKKSLNNDSSQDSDISQLIKDINNGNTYPQEVAFQMIDNGTKFGNVHFDESEFEKSEKNDILYHDVENEFTIPNEIAENDSLDISIPEPSESVDVLEEYLASESQFLKQENTDLPDFKDDSETVFNISDFTMPVDTENQNNLLTPIQRFSNHLQKVGKEFDISHQALASLSDGLCIFQNAVDFGKEFIIAQTDPVFQDFLSQGKALIISGALENSEYIHSLFSDSILGDISEIFIIPILDSQSQVEGIAVLAREKNLPPLTLEQKLRLFKI